MGIDLLDVAFRLERTFGVKISRDEFFALGAKNTPHDVLCGDLFELLRARLRAGAVLDPEIDADTLWPLFQREISDALGIESEDVPKDAGLIYDLGAT